MSEIKLNSVEEAIADFKEGKFVIVVDDEDRENEGDLIAAAEKITPEMVNFMLKHARGVLCVPITLSRCKELNLPHQVNDNTSVLGTPFTVTVDKLEGCSTGVSAHDRAETIRALADPASTPETFGRPGHINPLYAQDNGVFVEDKDSPYVNIIVARTDNKDSKAVQDFVKSYQTEEVYDEAKKYFKDGVVKGW